MVNVPPAFIHHVTRIAFDEPGNNDERIAKFFRYWHDLDASGLGSLAKDNEVELNDLLKGNPVSALRLLAERRIEDVLSEAATDPLLSLRQMIKPVLSKQAKAALEYFNLRYLSNTISTVDIVTSTQGYFDAACYLLSLLGFSETDSWWEASCMFTGIPLKERFSHPDELKERRLLPYDDYAVHWKFARGTHEAEIIAHHKNPEDMYAMNPVARSFLSNSLLIDSLPVINARELSQRRTLERLVEQLGQEALSVPRDALGMAFDCGYTIVMQEGLFAYHPRVLAEHLCKKLEKPEHEYFFIKAIGMNMTEVKPGNIDAALEDNFKDYMKAEHGQLVPEDDLQEKARMQKVTLNNKRSKLDADLSLFLPIVNSVNSKRLAGIKSLSNLYNLRPPFALQSRLEHCIGVFQIANVQCNRFGIVDYDRLKVLAYALVHDWGHLTGSHPTELYFKAMSGFDHEEFAVQLIEQNKELFDNIVDHKDIIAMFRQQDPLHTIVDGPWGADRIYYLTVDPNMCGRDFGYQAIDIIQSLSWVNGQVVVDQMPKAAFEFLDYRAQMYEELYFAPDTQIADACLQSLFYKAGIKSPFDKLCLKKSKTMNIIPEEQREMEFWKMNDILLYYYYFSNHPDRDVSEPMRQIMAVFHKACYTTAAALKGQGYCAEPDVELPEYQTLKVMQLQPIIHEVSFEDLAKYQKVFFSPEKRAQITKTFADMIGIPERYVLIAAVPQMAKLASEYAPVRIGRDVKSLFEWHPEYSKPFAERANRMACLRVAVHPQLYPLAYEFFLDNALDKIAREVIK